MVSVATLRKSSARVYLHTKLVFEMAIKTLDQRRSATSASRAQQRTIDNVDVSVPPEVAKIIRVAPALAVTQRDHTRARDVTYAAPAATIEHVTYASKARVEEHVTPSPVPWTENVPQIFAPSPMVDHVAPALAVNYEGPSPLIDHMAAPFQYVAQVQRPLQRSSTRACRKSTILTTSQVPERPQETGHLSTNVPRP